MRFEFNVSVEVERESGKFASRDEIGEEIRTAIADADPGQISGVGADGMSEYNVIEFEVNDA
jgi:hypothetical protein